MSHFIIVYHISLVNIQTSYCNKNLLILDVKKLNKIMKLYYFYTLKGLWEGQGKIKMYYGMSRVKKQLSGKKVYCQKSFCYWKNHCFLPLVIYSQSSLVPREGISVNN